MLGEGSYEVYVADRGGNQMLGRITNISSIRWNRVRDDISQALVHVIAPGVLCSSLLGKTRTVRHEIVIFRNGLRVWEGPIVRIAYNMNEIEIDARDVMWYASRRVDYLGYDYTGNTGPTGGKPPPKNIIDICTDVMHRAYGTVGAEINEFNVAPWLTPIHGPDDPLTVSFSNPYSRSCWEVVDQFAESGGLDYVTIGRRIMWWDTHLRAHVLERLTDEDFTEPITVTEYGSELHTRRYVTDNEGNVHSAVAPTEWMDYYGYVDDVVNNVGEDQSTPANADTASARSKREGIILANQYPAPVGVHVPDNSGLVCDANVTIDQLIPGAWIPLYARLSPRPMESWQKLNEVAVDVESDTGEVVHVTMQQAPATSVDPA